MKFISFLSIIAISVMANAQLAPTNTSKVKWYTIQEAEKLNQTQPRKFMIDVYTDWCGWCKRMDAETFTHPVIAKYLNENYYAVKFNAERTDSVFFGGQWFKNTGGARSTHQLAQALLKGQLSYPTIVYINEKLELLGPVPGYKTPNGLEAWLVFVLQEKYKTTQFEEFTKTFVGQIKPEVQ